VWPEPRLFERAAFAAALRPLRAAAAFWAGFLAGIFHYYQWTQSLSTQSLSIGSGLM
jgi:hypothetical protein